MASSGLWQPRALKKRASEFNVTVPKQAAEQQPPASAATTQLKSAEAVDDAGETPTDAAERRALGSARERPDGARASTWGDIATLLGGSGRTKHLKAQLAARASKGT